MNPNLSYESLISPSAGNRKTHFGKSFDVDWLASPKKNTRCRKGVIGSAAFFSLFHSCAVFPVASIQQASQMHPKTGTDDFWYILLNGRGNLCATPSAWLHA